MMATTHVFAGLAIISPVVLVVPEFGHALAIGAIIGGLIPDFDLIFTHRRTLHFPVAGVVPVVGVSGIAMAAPSSATAALAAVAVAAWLHAASDALGGGPEMDPWNNRSDRAVYDHVRGQWIQPRRWIRYDGAPEDAALGVGLAIPAMLVFEGVLTAIVGGAIALSLGYAALRRRLVAWIPDWLE